MSTVAPCRMHLARGLAPLLAEDAAWLLCLALLLRWERSRRRVVSLPSKTNDIVFTWCKTAPFTFPCTAACIPVVNPEGKQWAESSGAACVFTKQKGWKAAEAGRRNRCTKDLGQR